MADERDAPGGAGRRCPWATPLSRVLLAELGGTALLVLLTCLPQCAEAGRASALYRALASGLVVTALVQCFDHISGAHFNPTVTLAAALWGRVGRARAAATALAQLAGAALGASALHLLRPGGGGAEAGAGAGGDALCVTLPAEALAAYKAALVEAVLGGVLALVNCAAWDARVERLKDSWPLRIGCTVAALSLVAGELTGASMNPVRSFGPALCTNVWTHHWVYWVGPLSGSALCTAAYCALWRPRERPHGAPAPLAPFAPRAPLAPAPRPDKPRDAV